MAASNTYDNQKPGRPPLNSRREIVAILGQLRDDSFDRFGLKKIGLFGSAARDELGEASDVDILIKFRGRATFDVYMDLKYFLEDLIGRTVDLVTEDNVRSSLRPYIEQDLIRVA